MSHGLKAHQLLTKCLLLQAVMLFHLLKFLLMKDNQLLSKLWQLEQMSLQYGKTMLMAAR